MTNKQINYIDLGPINKKNYIDLGPATASSPRTPASGALVGAGVVCEYNHHDNNNNINIY